MSSAKVSEVWEHFTKEVSRLVRCNRCQKAFNQHRTTTMYWLHLKHRHEAAYAATNYYKAGVENGKQRRLSAQTPRKEQKETPVKFSFTNRQRKLLELSFKRAKFISPEERSRLAERFGVGETSIKNWFMARRHQAKRRSLQDEPMATEHVANEAEANNLAHDDDASDAPMGQAANEPQADSDANGAAAASAATPDGQSDSEPSPALALAQFGLLHDIQFPTMPLAMHNPQPMTPQQTLPAPMQQAPAMEDDLVEASGRAMMIRLRQLHEKHPKLFLQAQNAIGNAIFQYEMEADEQ